MAKGAGKARLLGDLMRVSESGARSTSGKLMASASLGRRRAMVVISDGEDTESERELKDVIDITADMNELKDRLAGIARELRSQYLIACEPTNGNYDGKFRQVVVKLPNLKDLRIRTKKGYTACCGETCTARS
jgi:hypothetical protein